MKKMISMLLSVTMLFSLAACGNSASKPNNGSSASSSSTPNAASSDVASTPEIQEWQPDSITLIIPYSAGGGMENMRTFAKYWEKYLGCEIVVDNRAGANGQVGTTYFTSLPADCTNVLAQAELYFSYSITVQGAGYAVDDFTFMNLHEVDPCAILLASGSALGSSFGSFDELNEYIQAHPGEIRLGCATGGSTMILAEQIKDAMGWDVKTVLYDGGSDLKTATLGGHVDIAVSTVSTANESGCEIVLVDSEQPVINHEDAKLAKDVLGKAYGLGSVRFFALMKEAAENYPERYQKLMETMEQTYSDPEYLKEVANLNKQDYISFSGPEIAKERIDGFHDLAVQYHDALTATANG